MEQLFERLRRHAPASLDFDRLVEEHQRFNASLVSAWLERYPEADAAMLHIEFRASGHLRRRLRRYREFGAASRDTPDALVFREAVPFSFLDLHTVKLAAAAARADVSPEPWRLMTVAEVLAAPP